VGDDSQIASVNNLILELLGPDMVSKTHHQFMEIADHLYENGISCLDVLAYLESTSEDRAPVIKLRFCYNKIKSEFRSEKMLMLYLFDLHYLRSNTNLKNVSFL